MCGELLTTFECLYVMASSQAILVISSRLSEHLGEPSKLNKWNSLSIFLDSVVCLVTENISEADRCMTPGRNPVGWKTICRRTVMIVCRILADHIYNYLLFECTLSSVLTVLQTVFSTNMNSTNSCNADLSIVLACRITLIQLKVLTSETVKTHKPRKRVLGDPCDSIQKCKP